MRRYRGTILKREMINREHEIQVNAITQCDNLAHMIWTAEHQGTLAPTGTFCGQATHIQGTISSNHISL